MKKSPHVVVIGSGFAGMSAACTLAAKGYRVDVFEKNEGPGGRARLLRDAGFTFDMGPSWYWMPDVFESFFERFGKKVSDYYSVQRLDPSYRVYFDGGDKLDLPADAAQLGACFETFEPGAAKKLERFLAEAKYKYEVGIKELVYKPCLSLGEFADWKLISGAMRLDVFKSMHAHVRQYFRHPKILQILEFPVLFLGETPRNTPALYSLMNYADIKLGTWYPEGGMYAITDAMYRLAVSLGVQFHFNSAVEKVLVENGHATGVRVNGQTVEADVVIGAADYHHVEQHLLDAKWRRYDEAYWNSRKMAPSCLIYFLGLNKKLKGLQHHNLFFDESFDAHAREIYDAPAWPQRPLFYVCAPSVTDKTVAPEGCENLFVLIPVAPGLEEETHTHDHYFKIIADRIEKATGEKIAEHVIIRHDYSMRDFKNDYNAFRGNAYGLANTLKQTAILKPSIKSKKVNNLYYAGQLTVPGPGVPPAIISGLVAGDLIMKEQPVKAHTVIL